MFSNLNNFNAIEMNDAELELVSGGAFLTPVKSEAQKAGELLSAIYKANHPSNLVRLRPRTPRCRTSNPWRARECQFQFWPSIGGPEAERMD